MGVKCRREGGEVAWVKCPGVKFSSREVTGGELQGVKLRG